MMKEHVATMMRGMMGGSGLSEAEMCQEAMRSISNLMHGVDIPESLLPEFQSNLEMVQDSAAAAKKAKSRGLPPVGSFNLMSYEMQSRFHLSLLREVEEKAKRGPGFPTQSTTMAALLTHRVVPASLRGMEPVTLRQISRRVNEIQYGKVLFATIKIRAYKKVGTVVFIQDEAGDGVELGLYNYVLHNEDPKQMLPVGSRLAVIAPYMRHVRDEPESNHLILRCDNPQAVVVFDSDKEWLAAKASCSLDKSPPPEPQSSNAKDGSRGKDTAMKLCEQGNADFKRGNLKAALCLYGQALDAVLDDDIETSVRILSNRAASLMRLERWEEASAEAIRGARLAPLSPSASLSTLVSKCWYRHVQALLLLQKPQDALNAVKLAIVFSVEGLDELLEDATRMLTERVGDYELPAMLEEVQKETTEGQLSPQRHWCHWESPMIDVRQVEMKGRGIFAKASIPSGTLIMA